MEEVAAPEAQKSDWMRTLDWAVISLVRTPHRLEQFNAFNGIFAMPVGVFEAVDGQTLDRERLIEEGLLTRNVDHWSMGSIGSALSHRALWRQAADTGRIACIFEDDVILREDFVERVADLLALLPPDWDMVLLGYNTDSVLDITIAPGCDMYGCFTLRYPTLKDCANFAQAPSTPVTPVRLNNAFGICAYLISPQGARQFIDKLFPLDQRHPYIPALGWYLGEGTIDGNMNDFYRSMETYVCLPPIVLPINDKRASTNYPRPDDAG